MVTQADQTIIPASEVMAVALRLFFPLSQGLFAAAVSAQVLELSFAGAPGVGLHSSLSSFFPLFQSLCTTKASNT